MKNGWQSTTLGEICAFENGDRGANYPGRSVQTATGIPFVNAGHLTDDGIDLANMNYIPRKRFELLGNGKIRQGDILFCLRGSLGKFASVGNLSEGAIASSIVIIRPKDDLVEDRFLLMYLRSNLCAAMIDRYKNGAAQPNLSARSLTKFEIPLPPLPEQRRIVAILDEAFAGIATAKAHAEKNLQNARALFESHLNAVFTQRGEGWVEKRLGDIAKAQYGLSQSMNEAGRGYKIFRMGEVQDGRLIDTGRMKFVDINETEFAKYKLARGDVLFNRTNSFELVGKTGVFDLQGDYCFASYLVRVLLDRRTMLSEFLNYQMNSAQFQASVKQKASKSINQANINATILLNETVYFPDSLDEQSAVARKLDVLAELSQRLESIYERKRAALDEVKKSLLHQAFSGQI